MEEEIVNKQIGRVCGSGSGHLDHHNLRLTLDGWRWFRGDCGCVRKSHTSPGWHWWTRMCLKVILPCARSQLDWTMGIKELSLEISWKHTAEVKARQQNPDVFVHFLFQCSVFLWSVIKLNSMNNHNEAVLVKQTLTLYTYTEHSSVYSMFIIFSVCRFK